MSCWLTQSTGDWSTLAWRTELVKTLHWNDEPTTKNPTKPPNIEHTHTLQNHPKHHQLAITTYKNHLKHHKTLQKKTPLKHSPALPVCPNEKCPAPPAWPDSVRRVHAPPAAGGFHHFLSLFETKCSLFNSGFKRILVDYVLVNKQKQRLFQHLTMSFWPWFFCLTKWLTVIIVAGEVSEQQWKSNWCWRHL